MSQANEYYDINSYDARRNGGKQEGKSGVLLTGIVIGMIMSLLIVGAILMISYMTGMVKKNNDKSFGNLYGASQSQDGENEGSSSGEFVSDRIESKINGLVEIIRDEFFLEEVTDEELEAGLYKGLMESLGDPYSEYYTAEEFNELMTQSSGVYYGIGAYVSMDSEYNLPKISGVFKNSPAQEAGLRSNDLIYMVDGEITSGKTLSEVVSLIKGEENTKVLLTIVRDGEQLEKSVTRRQVESPTVDSEMLDDGMGYIRLEEFDDVTTNQFLEAMEELNGQGMKGLILDLRGNPGGNLATVVQIAQNMLPEGIIVYTEDKEQHRSTYRSKGDKQLGIPLVVLVDMNSASASEILAGAIQDYGIGTLVGTKTFGKGIVQSVIPLKDGSAIKITVSAYYTPKGRNIHKIGIDPDVVCEFDSKLYYDAETPIDNQLEKAKEILKGKMK